MKTVVTFGEILMRLQPADHERLMQARSLRVYYGGSEANVAAALAQWGNRVVMVSKLPDGPIGDACAAQLAGLGVDTFRIGRAGGRMGLYFCEEGATNRPPRVVYDRAGSAFARSGPDDFDFDAAMEGAGWFHFSGITPALGGSLPDVTAKAVACARARGLKVSCDFNFRSALWSPEQAARTMEPLFRGLDLLVINENQAREVFGIGDGDERQAEAVRERFGARMVALTKRRTVSGEVNTFSALLYDGKNFVRSREYSMFMIDKIGGGDAFDAGLLHMLANGRDMRQAVDFAAAALCLKHGIRGDMLLAGEQEVWAALNGDSALRR